MDISDEPPGYSEIPERASLWTEFANGDNLFANNGDAVARRIGQLSGRLFCSDGKMQLDLLDVRSIGTTGSSGQKIPSLRSQRARSIGHLDGWLKQNSAVRMKLISFHTSSPSEPLSVTSEAMHKIFKHCKIAPHFLDIMLSFAVGTMDSEASAGSMTHRNRPDGSYELQYIIRYPEQLSNGNWEISQTAIYHRHHQVLPGNVWIILHSRPDSILHARLGECERKWEKEGGAKDEWQFVHLLVLSSYIGGWRWYLQSLSEEIDQLDIEAQSLLHSNSAPRNETLFSLHHVQSRLLPLVPLLSSSLDTVKALHAVFTTLRQKKSFEELLAIKMIDELRMYEVRLAEYLVAVGMLEKKARGVRDLVRDCRG